MINKQFTSFFGYTKAFVEKGTMNNFLPGIYAKHHNKFVKNFFVQKGELDSPYFNTDHKSFIKTKSGYIAEVIYNVKM